MKQTFNEIAELAEDIGTRNLTRGKVNLAKIAKQKNIELIFGNYGNHFLGELVHCSKRFYIHLNLDKIPDKNSARMRFTIAHELGHYFIDNHRTKLSKGISVSYNGYSSNKSDEPIERQANHFASHLLMPKKHFIRLAKKFEPGINAILKLKSKYDTSIECSALHYINLNLTNSIMFRWRSDFTFHYCRYSEAFSQSTGLIDKAPIKFNTEYIKEKVNLIDKSGEDYSEAVAWLSRWIYTISPGSKKDIVGLEQTIKLGEFGGITILTFQ
jgi:Zn-dependent peptidase ImmA (M78 family)